MTQWETIAWLILFIGPGLSLISLQNNRTIKNAKDKEIAAGRTRRRLGNTSTVIKCAFWHSTKSSSAAGRTRRRLGDTSTVIKCAKPTSCASCSWWWLCWTSKRTFNDSACVAKPTLCASCTWWWLW